MQRGYTAEETGEAGALPKRHSMDMAMKLAVPDGDPTKRVPSTEDLHRKIDTGAESDTALMEPPKRRGKSPFRFFKKKDEKAPEGPLDAQMRAKGIDSPPGTSLTVRDPSLRASATQLVPPAVPDRPTGLSPSTAERAGSPRRQSRAPADVIPPDDGSDYLDSSSLDLCDEYYYGIRILPGQEPNQVYCGWVTTTYKQFDTTFETNRVRKVVFQGLEENAIYEMYVIFLINVLVYDTFL